MRAVIASGTGRYSDPWHPFEKTSPLVAEILNGVGFTVAVDDDVDRAMTALDGVDLLVVNAGDPWRGSSDEEHAPGAAVTGFATAIDRGIGVLALHCAVSSLRDYAEWFPAIGGMWVPGLSYHPPAAATDIRGGSIPDGPMIGDFDVFDECYCRIQRIGRSVEVAHHDASGHAEPAAWVRHHGLSRVAVDLLGHDERSYAAPGHQHMLTDLALWAATPRS